MPRQVRRQDMRPSAGQESGAAVSPAGDGFSLREPWPDRFAKAPLPNPYDSPGRYEAFSYSGAAGLLMNLNHRFLELGIKSSDNHRVLDVGGMAMPHWHWMNLEKTESYYFLGDPAHFDKLTIPESLRGAEVRALDYRDESLSAIPPDLTRIVASHVLEHIRDPEEAILLWCRHLRRDGVLSIAIPCDPGWTWRLLQHISSRSAIAELGFADKRERDLFQSRDHVTSASNILKVMRFYFRKMHVIWFPTMVPVIDFNALCIIRASMKDFYRL